MRKDLAKKLCERPRYGGDDKKRLKRERRKGKNPKEWDNLPSKQSCKKVNIPHWSGKYLNDFLAPLKGIIRKNVGRPWDKVYSELREQINGNSVTQLHILDHLYGYVEVNPVWIDGVPHSHNMPHYPLPFGGWYVDGHGLLKAVKKKRPRKRYVPEPRKEISSLEEYRRIHDAWYYVRYRNLRSGDSGFDVILNREFKMGMWAVHELEFCHGPAQHAGQLLTGSATRLAVEKRQLSKKDIKSLGLDNL